MLRVSRFAPCGDETEISTGLQHLDQPTEILKRACRRNMNDAVIKIVCLVKSKLKEERNLNLDHASSARSGRSRKFGVHQTFSSARERAQIRFARKNYRSS